ncbi:hypothetical protein FE810_14650 [Thalassotalea litorea]|uniref:Putative Flp pilus-assembly TadG-like N-terminal domain-containing protein n=1 Tax=Thalassotalea litorea TaxID=2020715 RepID=A0A5R9IFZ9_9GAMM|nr:Tad domain-containing protein [Thalassotalea litorea]TLU61474.1 hypothetical protein FE810_14650 [Thalassotalea litorea]
MNYRNKHKGNIIVLATISLLAILAVSALALDGGHLLLNKSRLQNLADAAALSAAKSRDRGGTFAQARAEAVTILTNNLTHSENRELQESIPLDIVNTSAAQVTSLINIEFSVRPDPFNAVETNEALYAKVTIENVGLTSFLAQIFGYDKGVSSTALAGPSTDLTSDNCTQDLVPLLICGDKTIPRSDNGAYGFSWGDHTVMKIGSNTESKVGSGNFQLVRLPGMSGKNDVRDGLANGASFCLEELDIDSFETEPGDAVGPTEALDARFTGSAQGNKETMAEDWNTCQGPPIAYDDSRPNLLESGYLAKAYRYADYLTDTEETSCSVPGNLDVSKAGRLPDRRMFNVVVVECDSEANGHKVLSVIDFMCVFLTQQVPSNSGGQDKEQSGGNGQKSYAVGEVVRVCPFQGDTDDNDSGLPGSDPNSSGAYRIVLYHVPDSKDS